MLLSLTAKETWACPGGILEIGGHLFIRGSGEGLTWPLESAAASQDVPARREPWASQGILRTERRRPADGAAGIQTGAATSKSNPRPGIQNSSNPQLLLASRVLDPSGELQPRLERQPGLGWAGAGICRLVILGLGSDLIPSCIRNKGKTRRTSAAAVSRPGCLLCGQDCSHRPGWKWQPEGLPLRGVSLKHNFLGPTLRT